MNVIMFVGFFMRLPTLSTSLPNAFSEDVFQLFLYFEFLISCLELISFLVSVSMTSKAWWMLFSSYAMVASTVDACPFCVLFSNLAN